jgi:hypothetical protein
MPIIPGIQENKKGISYDSELFFPKALNMGLSGRSSDLSRSHEAFPSCFLLQKAEQWQVIIKPSSLERSGITAAGTVADSDRIPFSVQ